MILGQKIAHGYLVHGELEFLNIACNDNDICSFLGEFTCGALSEPLRTTSDQHSLCFREQIFTRCSGKNGLRDHGRGSYFYSEHRPFS